MQRARHDTGASRVRRAPLMRLYTSGTEEMQAASAWHTAVMRQYSTDAILRFAARYAEEIGEDTASAKRRYAMPPRRRYDTARAGGGRRCCRQYVEVPVTSRRANMLRTYTATTRYRRNRQPAIPRYILAHNMGQRGAR